LQPPRLLMLLVQTTSVRRPPSLFETVHAPQFTRLSLNGWSLPSFALERVGRSSNRLSVAARELF
jgi:hypothetical protein